MLLKIFSNNVKNMQKTWEGINALLNRKKKTLIKINCLKQPDSNTTTNMKSRILNVMNEHFTGIGPTLANNLPTPKELFAEFLGKNKLPETSFFFSPISPTLEFLSMSNNKSYGFYSCPVSIRKHASDILSDILTKIFDKCIDLGTFPYKLNVEKVIPIFKCDDKTDPIITTDQYLYYLYYLALTEFLKNLFIRE